VNQPLTLRAFSDLSQLKACLVSKKLSLSESENKAEILLTCAKALRTYGLDDGAAVRAFFVPGRIEVLGKHTDYAGGRSIVAATEKGFCIVAAKRQDNTVRILDIASGEKVEFTITDRLQPRPEHWSNYPMTVARRLARNFPGPLQGAKIAFASDLPPAAGMASSSAMIVGSFLVLSTFNNLSSRKEYHSNISGPTDLAAYLATVENGRNFGTLAGDKGVGTFGGSEDHTAILCCRAGLLSRYSYCPVRFERDIEFPFDYVLAIASSGVVAEKTGAAMEKYNRVSELCRCVVQLWNKTTGRADPHLAAAIASSPDAPDHIRNALQQTPDKNFSPEELLKRLEHFLAESEQIIPAAGTALAAGDLAEFDRQVTRSQELAETLLGNQVPETVFLARCARDLGAIAASAFGAGFGGSVWALTKADRAEQFLAEWSALYKSEFPTPAANAVFLLTRPGPAAFEL
jgi:galactokinase